MSHTTQCPHCKLEWIALDKIPAEFEFNLLKARHKKLRHALEEIEEREWDSYSSELASMALREDER